MEIEPISGIRKDSPAEAAGFRKGDRIVKVNGQGDFDPIRLPGLCFASAGKPMTFEVERDGGAGKRHTETLTVTPDDTPPRTKLAFSRANRSTSRASGCAIPVRTHVVAVRPDSPAAKAGLKPGDVINALDHAAGQDDRLLRAVHRWPILVGWDKADRTIEFKKESSRLVLGLDATFSICPSRKSS